VHKKDGAAGKIRVNDLARELGIKSTPILAYLAELGHPNRSHSNVIDGALAVRVREHFGPAADRRGDMKRPSMPDQVSHDLEFLRANVAELEAKLSKPGQVPPEILIRSGGVPAKEGAPD
jgi:translation initiation factor IF-2